MLTAWMLDIGKKWLTKVERALFETWNLKKARRQRYYSRTQNVNDETNEVGKNERTSPVAENFKFSGTDYGLQSMSVTVGISMELPNAHLAYYNSIYPDSPM